MVIEMVEREIFRDLARGHALGRFMASTQGAYEGACWLWVLWREWGGGMMLNRGKCFSDRVVEELAECITYCCAIQGIRSQRSRANWHWQFLVSEKWIGKSLSLGQFLIKAVKKGIKTAGTSYPEAGVKTVDVGDVEGNGRSGEGLKNCRVDRLSTHVPHIAQGLRLVRRR